MSTPFPLFHWSPSERRKGIIRRGMDIGRWSVKRDWKPPLTCWASNPHLAWRLSGDVHRDIDSWDLWMTWSDDVSGYEQIIDYVKDSSDSYVKEYRIYERIPKSKLWFVGTRRQRGERA